MYKTPEAKRKYNQEYNRRWRIKNREHKLKYQREYYQRNKEKWALDYQKRSMDLKMDVLIHYSGNPPKCACCNENHIEFLGVDHIYPQLKEKKSRSGHHFYYWLKKHNYPEGFRVLCFNCNLSLGFHGYCPHQKP